MGDGTTKEAHAWKTYWHELKYRARKRDTEIRQHARGTGGGPAKKPLTVTESRILRLLGEVSYAGHPEVQIPLNLPNPGNSAPAVLPINPPPSTSPVRNLQNAGSASDVPNPPPSPPLPRGINPELQNAGPSGIVLPNPLPSPLPQGINPELQNADSRESPLAMDPASPPPLSPSAGSSDSVPIGPRRGRTAAQVRNSRPYRRHRYDDPPVWARRYEEQRLRIDRDRARLIERLVEIAQQALSYTEQVWSVNSFNAPDFFGSSCAPTCNYTIQGGFLRRYIKGQVP